MSININIEYKTAEGIYPKFFSKMQDKSLAVLCDFNTKPFADELIKKLEKICNKINLVYFDDRELIPNDYVCEKSIEGATGYDYVLAVGSGSLNDVAKYVGTTLKIESGVLATAASMDGYVSKGSALMLKGYKVTKDVNTPADILIDLDIISAAPRLMTAAGFGDIIGKFTCLTDWQLGYYHNGEEINKEAFELMEKARTECVDSFDDLKRYTFDAVAKLMDALLIAGLSMAMCGNSRPASGSEHHISHYLEMDFVRRGEVVPPHGVKVAIGTLVSIELYNYLKDNNVQFKGCEEVYKLVEKLPSALELEYMLEEIGCPTRFSDIGVDKTLLAETIAKAYTVRDRYTVLTLINELGLTDRVLPIILEKYLQDIRRTFHYEK